MDRWLCICWWGSRHRTVLAFETKRGHTCKIEAPMKWLYLVKHWHSFSFCCFCIANSEKFLGQPIQKAARVLWERKRVSEWEDNCIWAAPCMRILIDDSLHEVGLRRSMCVDQRGDGARTLPSINKCCFPSSQKDNRTTLRSNNLEHRANKQLTF